MKINPYYQWQKDSAVSVDFSDVHIMRKFAGQLTSNLSFKVMLSLNVKYIKNGTR